MIFGTSSRTTSINPNILSDLYKIDMPAPLIEKQKSKIIKQAKKLLQKEGLLPPDEPLAS